MTEVSVVIPNFNGAGFILDCLEALRVQSSPAAEIIVVDNGSSDGSRSVIENAAIPGVRVLALDRNRGFAGGANAGVAQARSPLVAVLNSDARPRPDWLERLTMVVATCDDDVWAWGSILVAPDRGVVESAGDEWSPRGFAFKRQKGEPLTALPAEPYEAFAPPGAAPLFRRDVFERLGGYCDRFFLYYEDIDLAHRARRAGYRVVVVPTALVDHDLGRSGQSHRSRFFIARNSLWCTVRNAPELEPKLWWRTTVNDWKHAGRGGYRWPYLRGRVVGMLGLPRVLVQRRSLRRTLAAMPHPAKAMS